MSNRHVEAGRLGAVASRQYAERQRKERLRIWDENPKRCKGCGEKIVYEKRRNNFCNHSCGATFNNKGVCRNGTPLAPVLCGCCGKRTSNEKYCGFECQQKHSWNLRKEYFEKNGVWEGVNNETSSSRNFKKYLVETTGHCCQICGLKEWMGQKIPLVLDHINGDSTNNQLVNLRLVCGNCDMQLPTYKSKNKGNGRASRRKRYAEGKSY